VSSPRSLILYFFIKYFFKGFKLKEVSLLIGSCDIVNIKKDY
jgi:hypothetical protein